MDHLASNEKVFFRIEKVASIVLDLTRMYWRLLPRATNLQASSSLTEVSGNLGALSYLSTSIPISYGITHMSYHCLRSQTNLRFMIFLLEKMVSKCPTDGEKKNLRGFLLLLLGWVVRVIVVVVRGGRRRMMHHKFFRHLTSDTVSHVNSQQDTPSTGNQDGSHCTTNTRKGQTDQSRQGQNGGLFQKAQHQRTGM